jgi:hypothetical protein
MREVARILAWDAVLVHLSSAALFIGFHVLIIVNADEHIWWVLGFLVPLLVVMMAGWWVQMDLLLRATARLRGREGA